MDVPPPTRSSGASSASSGLASTAANLNSVGEDDPKDDDERVLSQILVQANVSVTDVDPSSLRALREHLSGGGAAQPSLKKPSKPFEEVDRKVRATARISGVHDEGNPVDHELLLRHGRIPSLATNVRPSPASQPAPRGGGGGPFSRGPSGTLSQPLTASEAEALYRSKLSKEDRILLQLEEQTKLLLQLHDRVTQLSNAVLSGSTAGNPSHWNDSSEAGRVGRAPGHERASQQGELHPPPPPLLPRGADPPAAHPPQQRNAPAGAGAAAAAPPPPPPPGAGAQAPNLVVLPLLGSLIEFVGGIPDRLRNSRPARIVRLYVALRRRQVPELDMAMLFKVLIMAAILLGRMGRAHSAPPNKPLRFPPDGSMTLSEFLSEVWKRYRFHVASTLIIAGFLVQTGYAKFLYNFVVKEDYPGRIWNGEDLDVEQVLREQQQREPPQPARPGPAPPVAQGAPGAAAAPEGNGPAQPGAPPAGPVGGGAPAPQIPAVAPLGYVVGGRVPRNDDRDEGDDDAAAAAAGGGGRRQQRRRRMPAPIRIVVEVGYLLSSFVLSIFPMWQPVAMEEEPPPRGGEHDGNDEQGNRGREDPGQLPRVRPPQDPAEYEDDDEDEYDEDGFEDGDDESDGE